MWIKHNLSRLQQSVRLIAAAKAPCSRCSLKAVIAVCAEPETQMIRTVCSVLFAALLLAACAGPTPYVPAENGTGFQDIRIEPGRYRVQFAGNSLTQRETVETYLLYRAAEVTLATGNDYFVIVAGDTEIDREYYTTVDAWHFSGPISFHYRGLCCAPLAFSETTRPIERYTAIAEIRTFQGEPPVENVNAYDARAVLANLGPRIDRGPEDDLTE